MPLITFTPMATVASQGRMALKWMPAWISTMSEPSQALNSCRLSSVFGFPEVIILRLRSEYTIDPMISSVPGMPR
jgi:hypothetical protein